jgi:hypothetical protein
VTALGASGYAGLGPHGANSDTGAVSAERDPLAAPVLTDLPIAPRDEARLDRLYPALAAPSWAEEPAPAPAAPAVAPAAAPPIEPAPPSRADSREAPAPRPGGTRRRALWALPLAAAALAAVALGLPHLRGAPAAAPTALVRFDVTPADSRLFLDGAPLASNPIPLPIGQPHTIQALADGYELGVQKFLVDGPATLKLRLERPRKRR